VNRTNKIILPVGFMVLISPGAAHAYLDPGAGSYVFQVILAFVLGGLFSIKLYWRKIKAYFHRSLKKKDG
jgi:hypothetical protein